MTGLAEKRRGVTLLEVLVVVVIAAFLAAAVSPFSAGSGGRPGDDRAGIAAVVEDCRQTAIESGRSVFAVIDPSERREWKRVVGDTAALWEVRATAELQPLSGRRSMRCTSDGIVELDHDLGVAVQNGFVWSHETRQP